MSEFCIKLILILNCVGKFIRRGRWPRTMRISCTWFGSLVVKVVEWIQKITPTVFVVSFRLPMEAESPGYGRKCPTLFWLSVLILSRISELRRSIPPRASPILAPLATPTAFSNACTWTRLSDEVFSLSNRVFWNNIQFLINLPGFLHSCTPVNWLL